MKSESPLNGGDIRVKYWGIMRGEKVAFREKGQSKTPGMEVLGCQCAGAEQGQSGGRAGAGEGECDKLCVPHM